MMSAKTSGVVGKTKLGQTVDVQEPAHCFEAVGF